MASRAQIAALTHTDPVLQLPYRGESRSLADLFQTRASLTPADYSDIRLFLGGGKRGRTKARELVPLACPGCACRLTHFERSGRPPYFAAAVPSPLHGARCEQTVVEAPTLVPVMEPAIVELGLVATNADEPLLYTLDGPAADLCAYPLADARALLVQALNRAVPAGSQVQVGGLTYHIVAAGDLTQRNDGDAVAVYGRLSEAEWDQESGRLTLRATPRTVQVWATAGVPRSLLGYELHETVEAPLIRKPVPFIVFGTLKKLAAVCGIPVVRSASLVLLQPLTFSLRVLSAEQAQAAAALANELDELLASFAPPASESADSQV